MKIATMTTILFILAACSAFQPLSREVTDRAAGPDTSEAFKVGFHEGCMSGYSEAGNPYNKFTKNRTRYASDNDYKAGWDEAYDRCYKRYRGAGEDYFRATH